MDTNTISTLISSVGFPIVACIFMWKAMQDGTKAHKEEMDAMRESLNQNTVVLAELKTIIQQMNNSGGYGDDEYIRTNDAASAE